MEFKLKPPFNLIFMGLGILFLVYLFPLSSYAFSSTINLDKNGSFDGVVSSYYYNYTSNSYTSPITYVKSSDIPSLYISGSGFVGTLECHFITTEGDFVLATYTRNRSVTSSDKTKDVYLSGSPVGYYYYLSVSYGGTSTTPTSVPFSINSDGSDYINYTIIDSQLGSSIDHIYDNTDALMALLDTSSSHYYGSYTPLNFMYDTSLSSYYNYKVLKGGSNIVYSSGDEVVSNNYLYPVPVSDFVYFNTVQSNKYRFCFSTVLDSSNPIDFSAFSFNIKDSQGTTIFHASRSDFEYRIFNFGGVASGKALHFFYIDFNLSGVSDDVYLGYSLRAQPKVSVSHSYDSFGFYGYTGTVTDLIDWYENNWSNTSQNVDDLNNNTDGTNDTIGGINDTEGGYFDSYNSYVDTAGISVFNFDVIGSELAIASGFIGSLYSVLPSVFKYFIIGIMTIGTFALILSVGGRISKRRG